MATNDACDFYYSIGGGVHLGETAEEAVRREVLEETGLPYEIDRLPLSTKTFLRGREVSPGCTATSFPSIF